MKLGSFSYLFSLLIILFSHSMAKSEEKIDIWNKQNSEKIQEDSSLSEKKDNNSGEQINLIKKINLLANRLIEEAVNKAMQK